MDVKAYTRWLRSSITQELVMEAQAALMNKCKSIPTDTQWNCATKALLREGGEIVLNFLVSRPTVDSERALAAGEQEPTFMAGQILDAELNPLVEGK